MQYFFFLNCKIVLNTFSLYIIDLSDTEKSTEKKTLQTSVCLIRSEN